MLDIENYKNFIKPGRESREYYEDYLQLVEQCKPRGLNKEDISYYTEKHHILPKCMGGKDEESNYVLFSAREHIIAHILLYRAYPDNPLITHAANCMVLLKSSKSSGRLDKIESLDLEVLTELRELSGKLQSKPVMCYTIDDGDEADAVLKNINICKIYDSQTSTESDGFALESLHKAIKNGTKYGGYYWMRLSDAEEIYPLQVLEYKERTNGETVIIDYHNKMKSSPVRKESIVCYENSGDIIRIYNTLTDVNKDNFSIYNVSAVVRGRRNIHLGYNWKYLSDFKEGVKDADLKLESYYTLVKQNNLPKIKIPTKKIICSDPEGNIIRIYNKLEDVTFEGFSHTGISIAIKNNTKFKGYYWTKFDDWNRADKIEEYLNLTIPPKLIKPLSNKPGSIIKCNADGDIEYIYQTLSLVPEEFDKRKLIKTLEKSTDSRLYKKSYWYRQQEVIELFPRKLNEYISANYSENQPTSINLILTISSKLISVNELYKARVQYSGGRAIPVLYKNPKAVKVSEEVRDQLLSVDFTPYKTWLENTKKFSITINFVLKSGIAYRDCANFEKIMCDDLVKFIRNDVGVKHFDDSEFLEVNLVKSIIPNAQNEYALIQLKESKHNIRFDQIAKPERIFLAGPLFPVGDFNWKEEIKPYIVSQGLELYDPSSNILDPETRELEKYKKCNTIFYTIYPGIINDMPTVESQIMLDFKYVLENNSDFFSVGILGELEDWESEEEEDLINELLEIKQKYATCSRIKIGFINNPEEILEL